MASKKVALFRPHALEGTVLTALVKELMVGFKRGEGGVEVADFDLSKKKLFPCVGCFAGCGRTCVVPCDRNDAESDIYEPADQGQSIFDTLDQADIVIVASESRFGNIDHVTQRLIERLQPLRNVAMAGPTRLQGKPAVIAVVGESAAGAMQSLMAPLMTLGFALPSGCALAFDIPAGTSADDANDLYSHNETVRGNMSRVVDSALNSLRRKE